MSFREITKKIDEIIEIKNSNLDYLNQLKKSFEISQNGLWGQCMDLISETIGVEVQGLIGDTLDFDALKTTVQYISLINPKLMGEALLREVKNLAKFFQNEFDKLTTFADIILSIINKLDNEWSELTDISQLQWGQKKELNVLLNESVPAAGELMIEIKNDLIKLQFDITSKAINENDAKEQINQMVAKLNNAKAEFSSSPTDIISSLGSLMVSWAEVKEKFEKLKSPIKVEYTDMNEKFTQIGKKFFDSIQELTGLLNTIITALTALTSYDEKMFSDWKNTVNHIIVGGELKNYLPGSILKNAIDDFIDTGNTQTFQLVFPLIGIPISEDTFGKWLNKAKVIKLNKNTWIKNIESVINILSRVSSADIGAATGSYETIYEPITNAVINTYKTLTEPLWTELTMKLSQIENIIQMIIDQKNVTINIRDMFWDMYQTTLGIKNIMETDIIGYFQSNSPISNLATEMGLNNNTNSIISSLSTASDFLGYDNLSEEISNGNISGILNMDEKMADSTNQLLSIISETVNEDGAVKSAAIELQKIIMNDKLRKARLQKTSEQIIEEGIKIEEAEIAKMKELLSKL